MSLRPCPLPEEIVIRFIALTAAIVIALIVVPTATSASMSVLHAREHRQVRSLHARHGTIVFFHNHRWLARTHPGRVALRAARIWVPILRRELRETRAALHPRPSYGAPSWFVNAALCIHAHEGSWTDTGDPFWGGMQFMLSTWSRNGGVGLPSSAPPAEQIAVAYRTWLNAGGNSGAFHSQWPNSSRACGY